MRYDSNYYEPKTFVPKLNRLLDKKYSHLKNHKKRSTFIKEYQLLFDDDITESSKQWFAYTQKPKIDRLMNICEFFDCDIDYFLTEQETFAKDIASASEITGLNYKTIETLEKIKNNNNRNIKDYIDKCILFLLDFLIQRPKGRHILWNMFHYFFKSYSFVKESNNTSSNTIELEDNTHIEERNIGIYVDELSEQFFYSNIISDLVKIKTTEHTEEIDISNTYYTPSQNDIIKDIQKEKELIDGLKQRNFDEINPYTPKYALKQIYKMGQNKQNEIKDFSTIEELITKRVSLDLYNKELIEKAEQRINRLENKLNELYGIK